jgi:hypothetical protein
MATYLELYNIATTNSDLKNKVIVACLIAANNIRNELDTVPNHANRLIWAKETLENPQRAGDIIFPAVIAQNSGSTATQINTATDNAIQIAVNNTIDLVATG